MFKDGAAQQHATKNTQTNKSQWAAGPSFISLFFYINDWQTFAFKFPEFNQKEFNNTPPFPGHAHEIKRVRNKNLVAQAVAVGRMDGGGVRLEMLKMREGGVAAAAAAHL